MPADTEGAATERIQIERTAARVLPVNDRGEVLLLLGFEPAHPDDVFWFSVGGGLEDGERDRDAAVRELAEETGIDASQDRLQGPLLREIAEFSWGSYDVRQHQTWWAVGVGNPQVTFAGLDEIERATTIRYQWWTPDALAVAEESYGRELVELMRTAVELIGHP